MVLRHRPCLCSGQTMIVSPLPSKDSVHICYLHVCPDHSDPTPQPHTLVSQYQPAFCFISVPSLLAVPLNRRSICLALSLLSLSLFSVAIKKIPKAENHTQKAIYFVHCSGIARPRWGRSLSAQSPQGLLATSQAASQNSKHPNVE